MKPYDWNKDKNEKLKRERGISFEEIETALESGGLLEITDHPNPSRYPNQKIYLVNVKNYVYSVPFVQDEEKIFFKTIIPSRKATKRYLRNRV